MRKIESTEVNNRMTIHVHTEDPVAYVEARRSGPCLISGQYFNRV